MKGKQTMGLNKHLHPVLSACLILLFVACQATQQAVSVNEPAQVSPINTPAINQQTNMVNQTPVDNQNSPQPSAMPSANPTPVVPSPEATPTATPTVAATPTPQATATPLVQVSATPTQQPTPSPTPEPTQEPTPPVNLALNKPVVAAQSRPGYPPENVVDGQAHAPRPEDEHKVYWNKGSAMNGNDWIYIDLLNPTSISRVKVMPETSSGQSVTWDIEIALNANDWKKVGSGTAKIAQWAETTFPSVSARYVRIMPVNWGASWVSVREVEIYEE
jgi:hypothetical protein